MAPLIWVVSLGNVMRGLVLFEVTLWNLISQVYQERFRIARAYLPLTSLFAVELVHSNIMNTIVIRKIGSICIDQNQLKLRIIAYQGVLQIDCVIFLHSVSVTFPKLIHPEVTLIFLWNSRKVHLQLIHWYHWKLLANSIQDFILTWLNLGYDKSKFLATYVALLFNWIIEQTTEIRFRLISLFIRSK